jgi:hypothetical protein
MTAETTAGAMGRRAGEAFVATGVPTPNPFAGKLADAWRRAYFAAVKAARQA